MAKIAQDRTGLLRQIHARAREIGLADDDRKQMQLRLVGKESCAEMTEVELGKVAQSLQDRSRQRGALRKSARNVFHRKIYALWWDLGGSGGVVAEWESLSRDERCQILNGFVRKITGVHHVEWLTPSQANQVIEALKGRILRKMP